MTTIAAFLDHTGRAAIAADRQWSNRVGMVAQTKIRRFGGLVVGFSGPPIAACFDPSDSAIVSYTPRTTPAPTPSPLTTAGS